MDFLAWLRKLWEQRMVGQGVGNRMIAANNLTELETLYDGLTPDQKELTEIKTMYPLRRTVLTAQQNITSIIGDEVTSALDALIKKTEEFKPTTPDIAKQKLAALTTDVLKIAATVSAAEILTAKLRVIPAETSSGIYRRTLAWLGFGALLTAVAHDPVKIGFLRPYQDALEMTFRNRRPDDMALFQAYRTRELSPIKVDDLSKLTDAEMERIEKDNDEKYTNEIARWGYSEWFATALSRSATYTLTFSQLVTLARAGIFDRGVAIYSLWGAGIDKVMMPAALSALETLRDREMYSGFRSMIEPSYIEGDLTEEELKEYWGLAGVPVKVQDWVIVRLRKRRETFHQRAQESPAVRERDLTQAQIAAAYVEGLISRPTATADIIRLGYSAVETEILMSLADARKKTPTLAKRKRLPLSDYEKAWKAKIISDDAVVLRMTDEYDPRDIELERKLMKAGKQ